MNVSLPSLALPRAQRFRDLLTTIGMQPDNPLGCSTFGHDRGDAAYEYLHLLMALVEEADEQPPPTLDDAEGVFAYSVPGIRKKGAERDFSPKIDGHDNIVAALNLHRGSIILFKRELEQPAILFYMVPVAKTMRPQSIVSWLSPLILHFLRGRRPILQPPAAPVTA
jgi:hypothetical protein